MSTASGSRLPELLARLHPPGPAEADEPSLVWAAVALIVVPDPDAFLLIRRAERAADPWSGHLALPGGRRHPDDRDLADTAMRETGEEVGITLGRSTLAGTLDDAVPRTPTLPPVVVRPFVFTLPARPPIRLNREVAEAVWVELALCLAPDARHESEQVVRGERRLYPVYRTPAGPVWGMTERILTSFVSG